MPIDITHLFAERFSRNAGPVVLDGKPLLRPNYGISATFDAGVIDFELTFRSGSEYCCYESGCHVNFNDGERWEWLRTAWTEREPLPSRPLEMRLSVVVEEGARFFDFSRADPKRHGWYAFWTEAAKTYEVLYCESAS